MRFCEEKDYIKQKEKNILKNICLNGNYKIDIMEVKTRKDKKQVYIN